MEKQPTKDLIEEHGGIMLMLQIIEKVADKLKKGELVEIGHLNKIIEFLVNFVDKCHHGKEEGIYFPELAKNPSNTQIVNQLLGEHQTGRDLIRGISSSLPNYSPGNPDTYHLASNMDSYRVLLIEHIRKENTEFFPEADKQLSGQVAWELEKQFEALERDVIGEGKHEEYHGWLDELKQAYLIDV